MVVSACNYIPTTHMSDVNLAASGSPLCSYLLECVEGEFSEGCPRACVVERTVSRGRCIDMIAKAKQISGSASRRARTPLTGPIQPPARERARLARPQAALLRVWWAHPRGRQPHVGAPWSGHADLLRGPGQVRLAQPQGRGRVRPSRRHRGTDGAGVFGPRPSCYFKDGA
jgi:hypothetical protein